MEKNATGAAPPPDVVEIMTGIRARLEGERAAGEWGTAVEALRRSDGELNALRRRIGAPPPAPPTLRGRVGGVLVRVLNRLFWWQATPVADYADAMSKRAAIEARLIGEMAVTVRRMEEERERWSELLDWCRREIANCDRRLREMERAQLEAQSDCLEHARIDELAELRLRIGEVAEELKQAQAARSLP